MKIFLTFKLNVSRLTGRLMQAGLGLMAGMYAGSLLAQPVNKQSTNHSTPMNAVIRAENKALFAGTAFGWWRKDITKAQAFAFWRDIHGTLAARIPGLYQYRQLHLMPALPNAFGAIKEIDASIPPRYQPNGIAQLLFDSQEGQRKFGTDPLVTEEIFIDEQNLVESNATLWSTGQQARTLKDEINDPMPQGPVTQPTFVVAFTKKEGASDETFHGQVLALAQKWAAVSSVKRLRYQLLAPYDDRSWLSPNVKHAWPQEKQYRAWLEIVIEQESDLAGLPVENRSQLAGVVSAMHTYPVFEKYTLVFQGKPTEVGLRGYPAYKLIMDLKANNQRQSKLLERMYHLPAATPLAGK